MPKQKYYVVWKGYKPGVYETWDECRKQVEGFDGALYKSFEDKELAQQAFKKSPYLFINSPNQSREKDIKPKSRQERKAFIGKPVIPSISVDAACSGNPGVMEYQGVDTHTKKVIFREGPFPQGTNNIGEFLALVHGLALLKKQNLNIPIYSDSTIAIKWVKIKEAKTKLQKNKVNAELFEIIGRAEEWLRQNTWNNKILKWETKVWGEIPADFGRK